MTGLFVTKYSDSHECQDTPPVRICATLRDEIPRTGKANVEDWRRPTEQGREGRAGFGDGGNGRRQDRQELGDGRTRRGFRRDFVEVFSDAERRTCGRAAARRDRCAFRLTIQTERGTSRARLIFGPPLRKKLRRKKQVCRASRDSMTSATQRLAARAWRLVTSPRARLQDRLCRAIKRKCRP